MRVLVLSSPIYAHAVNASPFVAGLRTRGAEVAWGVPEPLLDTVRRLSDPDTVHDTGTVEPYLPRGGRIREVSTRYDWLLRDAATRLPALRRLVDDLRPDLILTDSLGHAAALTAEVTGLPWVSFGDGPLHHPDERTPPFGAGLPYRTPTPWVWRNLVVQAASRRLVMRRAQQRYAALRADLHLPPTSTAVVEAALSPHLHLHCGVPELEYPRRAGLPDHVHFVGAIRPAPATGWQPPPWWDGVVSSRSGQVVLATQGTLRHDPAELLAPAVQMLQETGRPGVVTTGSGDPALLGGPGLVGPAVAVESFVPYAEVLPHASVLITNGGWTGVLLALAHGVPVVQVGRSEEKADIGRRVQWAGAGLHLGLRPTPAHLGRALDRIEQDPAIRTGARRTAAALAERDPARDGAELITALFSGGEQTGPRLQ